MMDEEQEESHHQQNDTNGSSSASKSGKISNVTIVDGNNNNNNDDDDDDNSKISNVNDAPIPALSRSTTIKNPTVATADAVVGGGGGSGKNKKNAQATVYVWDYEQLKESLQNERSISNALVAYFSHDLRVKLVNAGVSMIELDNKMYNAVSNCTITTTTTTPIPNTGSTGVDIAMKSAIRRFSSSGNVKNPTTTEATLPKSGLQPSSKESLASKKATPAATATTKIEGGESKQ